MLQGCESGAEKAAACDGQDRKGLWAQRHVFLFSFIIPRCKHMFGVLCGVQCVLVLREPVCGLPGICGPAVCLQHPPVSSVEGAWGP